MNFKGCCVCRYSCVDIVSEGIVTVYKGFSWFFVDILLDLWFFRSWRSNWDCVWVLGYTWFVREVYLVACLVWNFCLTFFGYVSRKVGTILDLSCEAQFNCFSSVGFDLIFCKGQGNGLSVNLDLVGLQFFAVQACTWCTGKFKNIYQGIVYFKGCRRLRYFGRYIISKDFIAFIKSCSFFVVNVLLDFWLIWCWRCHWNFVRIFVHLRFVREASSVACLVWNFRLTIFSDVSWKVCICFNLSREGQFNSFTTVSFNLVFCKRQGNGLTFNLDLFSWNCLAVEGCTCTSCRICEFKNIY